MEQGKEETKEDVKEKLSPEVDDTPRQETKDIPPVVQKGIIAILKSTQKAINKQDIVRLDSLSEQAIQDAAIYQDQDSLSIAVAVLAISKLIKRRGYDTEYPSDVRNYLASAQFSLEEGSFEEYRDKVKKTFEFISSTDKEFKMYIDRVIEKAQIKKGSSLYERGISIARAAQLLGIGQWELMSYVGKTKIHDAPELRTRVGERVRLARLLFKT